MPWTFLLAAMMAAAVHAAPANATSDGARNTPRADAEALDALAHHYRDRPASERAQALHGRYLAVYGGVVPGALDDAGLVAMFESLATVSYYLTEPATARELLTVTAELDRRSIATTGHFERTHATLVAARLLEEARAFHDRHPGLEVQRVPAVEPAPLPSTDGPGMLVWDSGRGVLRHEPIKLDADYQVLVVSHPLCRFSKAALDAISNDAKLAAVFSGHATWVVAPPGNLPLEPMGRWQARHPDQRIGLIDRPASWRFIGTDSTPVFHFLKAGEVVETVAGWPGEGNREAVVAALQRIGALPGVDGEGD